MTSQELRAKFLEFFENRGHKLVSSASLVPENDSSVLFTAAGMQQFKSHYMEPSKALRDFGNKNVTTIQKCLRTGDIDEVGDDTHLTFFEMLGNFSFGGYGKKEAIELAHEFITKELQQKIDYVSVFEGDTEIPADEESRKVWQKIDPHLKIKNHNRSDNFWGPTGDEGPCGPTTEIYLKGVEIWNIVFNEFYKTKEGQYQKLETLGVDTGMGLERLAVQIQEKHNIFETDLFGWILATIQELAVIENPRAKKIVADHLRSATFLLADGVVPANTERGYILRRLIRRAIRFGRVLRLPESFTVIIAKSVIKEYKNFYPEIKEKESIILAELKQEEEKFGRTLERGLKEFERGRDPFNLYQSYGFPIEFTEELAREAGITIDRKTFDAQLIQHQELSRIGAAQKFRGGLMSTSEQAIKYHTATHLLHQALVEALGSGVKQRGSNITDERLRFDFTCDHKLSEEEKKRVELLVNEKIEADLPVNQIILPRTQAEKSGARHLFNEKYGNEVSIFFIGGSLDNAFSKEFCGGPHVKSTGSLGHFKIQKEEAVAAGIRRIKAVLN